MKKIIIAMNNNYLIKAINNYEKVNYKNLQYREAILETLEKDKNIDLIFMDEKIPGEINIEKLIEKIKLVNEKISITFFLEKEDNKKINKLKKLGVNNIYINKKANVEKAIDNLFKNRNIDNSEKDKLKTKLNGIIKMRNKIKDKISNKTKKELSKNEKRNRIITIEGKQKSGKTTIAMLLVNYLIIKNKKILLVNLNPKEEKHYYKISRVNKKKKDKQEIRVNKNLVFCNNFYEKMKKDANEKIKEFIKENLKNYDYIIFDIGDKCIKYLKKQVLNSSDKNLIVTESKFINYEEIKNLRKNRKVHIIYNKYKLLSISDLILKNIIGKNFYSKIPFNNNYKYLSKEFYKNKKKFKSYKIEKELEKIIIKRKKEYIWK